MNGEDLIVDDDLFSDPDNLIDAALTAPLVTHGLDHIQGVNILAKGLAQLVDEQHISGCRRYVVRVSC